MFEVFETALLIVGDCDRTVLEAPLRVIQATFSGKEVSCRRVVKALGLIDVVVCSRAFLSCCARRREYPGLNRSACSSVHYIDMLGCLSMICLYSGQVRLPLMRACRARVDVLLLCLCACVYRYAMASLLYRVLTAVTMEYAACPTSVEAVIAVLRVAVSRDDVLTLEHAQACMVDLGFSAHTVSLYHCLLSLGLQATTFAVCSCFKAYCHLLLAATVSLCCAGLLKKPKQPWMLLIK
jgi:hypothetical protein